VSAAQEGDRRALEELFARYLPRVRQIVALRMGRRQRQILEVDDVAQEALLSVFRGLERFEHRSQGSFRNWLARCVESQVAGAARKAGARKRGGGKVRLFCDLAPEGRSTQTFRDGNAAPQRLVTPERPTWGI
jgi:DNA-directed RNA polymerase specialized sigma24 family protein